MQVTLPNGIRVVGRTIENRPTLMRWILAGPITAILAVLLTAAMPLWLPEGAAGVDHIVFPIVLFPATWALLFFYAVLETSQLRSAIVFGAGLVVNTLLVLWAFFGGGA
ncbi:MAG: hypothetical protein AAF416_19845 [Pseudomonadota bacterium]